MRWLWPSLGTGTLVTGIVGAFSCMSWWRLPSWLSIAKTWTHPTVCRMPQAKQLTEQRHSLTHQQKLLKDFLSSQSPPDKALNTYFLTRGPRAESGPFALGSSHEPLDHPTHQEGRHQKQKNYTTACTLSPATAGQALSWNELGTGLAHEQANNLWDTQAPYPTVSGTSLQH